MKGPQNKQTSKQTNRQTHTCCCWCPRTTTTTRASSLQKRNHVIPCRGLVVLSTRTLPRNAKCPSSFIWLGGTVFLMATLYFTRSPYYPHPPVAMAQKSTLVLWVRFQGKAQPRNQRGNEGKEPCYKKENPFFSTAQVTRCNSASRLKEAEGNRGQAPARRLPPLLWPESSEASGPLGRREKPKRGWVAVGRKKKKD